MSLTKAFSEAKKNPRPRRKEMRKMNQELSTIASLNDDKLEEQLLQSVDALLRALRAGDYHSVDRLGQDIAREAHELLSNKELTF